MKNEEYNPSTRTQDFKEVYLKRNHGEENLTPWEIDEISQVQATNSWVADNADRLVARCFKAHKELKHVGESEDWKEVFKNSR